MKRGLAAGLPVFLLACIVISAASGRSNVNPPLWDQYDQPSYGGMTSQDFEPARDDYDSFGADDFIVPSGAVWSIDGVDVRGLDAPGSPVQSVNVRFYANNWATHLPGELVCKNLGQAFTGSPDFVIDLIPPCHLGPGAYWVSVQARQDAPGQWFWVARTTMKGNAGAAWQNPGNAFGTGCVSWGRRTECAGALGEPDNVFRLRGTTGVALPPPPPPPPPPPAPPPPPPPRVRCIVPRVLGLRLAAAKRKVRQRHCSVGAVLRRRSRRVGRVIYQRPYPGHVKRRGHPVVLVVGRR